MNKFNVYYMKPDSFSRFILGTTVPTLAELPDTHVFLRSINTYSVDMVFAYMQAEHWSPNGEARELIQSKGVSHTSMSVGDVVETEDGEFYACAPTGWTKLA